MLDTKNLEFVYLKKLPEACMQIYAAFIYIYAYIYA